MKDNLSSHLFYFIIITVIPTLNEGMSQNVPKVR